MEYDVLGKENSWVAEWPANPSANNLLHTDIAAWQWSSQGFFDFIPGINFDYNIDYSGRFTTNNNKNLLDTAVKNGLSYIYLTLSSDEFQLPKRLMVYLDGQYYFET
ncbi:hypothetical protein RV06_GL001671 [Enterococcus haemoperoxidus]|nr:hypothetical protein RV06_GL001671 [Enterococcus haemoperoxidus]